ncbi:hypothetical protein ACR9E3_13500 [Actinomycetospora sp. C-140]
MTTVDAIHAHPALPRPARTTAEIVYDVGTVLALAVGGLVVPLVGWVVGVALLWNGPRWNLAWRWLGTLAWPLSVALTLGIAMPLHGEGTLWIGAAVGVVALVASHVALAVAAAGDRR